MKGTNSLTYCDKNTVLVRERPNVSLFSGRVDR